MFGSYHLTRIRGIPIRIHGSLVLFVLVIAALWGSAGGLAGVVTHLAFLASLYLFVLLHELGHAVVAQRHGISVPSITLYPIGGIAALSHIPKDSKTELKIALAGPAVNVVLAAALGLMLAMLAAVSGLGTGSFAASVLPQLMYLNVGLAIFNMLPAFPLDGGRVLRALLAMRLPHARATRIAARTGQALAIAMGVLGVISGHLMLVVIAMFLFLTQNATLASQPAPASSLTATLQAAAQARQAARQGRTPPRPNSTYSDLIVEVGPDGEVNTFRRWPR